MKRRKIRYKLALWLLVLCTCMIAVPVQAAKKTALEKKAESIVKKQTNEKKDSKKQKLKKLFQYMEKCGYQRTIGFKNKKGWEKTYALEMLKKRKGSCYHYAAAYAFLAKKATGYTARVCIGKTNGFNAKRWQQHAWCELKIKGKWYIFDPNMDQYAAKCSGKYYWKSISDKKMKKTYRREKTITVAF